MRRSPSNPQLSTTDGACMVEAVNILYGTHVFYLSWGASSAAKAVGAEKPAENGNGTKDKDEKVPSNPQPCTLNGACMFYALYIVYAGNFAHEKTLQP